MVSKKNESPTKVVGETVGTLRQGRVKSRHCIMPEKCQKLSIFRPKNAIFWCVVVLF